MTASTGYNMPPRHSRSPTAPPTRITASPYVGAHHGHGNFGLGLLDVQYEDRPNFARGMEAARTEAGKMTTPPSHDEEDVRMDVEEGYC
jgi:hypothetical protein